MAAIKYWHSLVRPSELLSGCGWMMHFVDQPSGGRVLGFRRICQIIGFSMLLLGSGKKMLTTHGRFVQKCSVSLVTLMVKSIRREQRKELEMILGSPVIPPAPSPSPLSLDFPAAGVTLKVQATNSKNPVICPHSRPAFLAMFESRRLKTCSGSCKILILGTVLANLFLGYFLNHLDNVFLPFCIFS